jgi:diguanylate cyclase (GGDEF)-like protein
VRTGDTVARLGGDEFAVLVQDVADEAQMTAIARRLEHAFTVPFAAGGRRFDVRASIGRADWQGERPDALLRHADAAMYDVKRRAQSVRVR